MARAQPARLLTRGFVCVGITAFLEFLCVGMVIPALPRFVVDDLGRGTFAVGVAVGIFAVGAVGSRPPAGRWGDQRGRRPLVTAGLVVTAVATAGVGLIPNFWALLALRVLTGVGQALFFVGAATLAADLAPEERRGEALSVFSLPVYLGLGLGPALGEAVLHAGGASRVFEFAGLMVLVALPVVPFLPDVRAVSAQAGAAGPRWLHPAGVGPGLVILLGVIGFIGFQAYVPLYADRIGLRDVQLIFLLYSGILMTARIISARWLDRLGYWHIAAYANVLVCFGLVTMSAVARPAAVYAGLVPLAVGMAMQYPALIALALAGSPEHERARVISTFTAFFDVAQVAGGLILGAAASGFGERAVFLGGGISAALAIVVLVLLPKRVPQQPIRADAEPAVWAPPGAE